MPDKVTITKSKLDSLANTIAAKTGDPLPLTINQMKSAIYNLEIGGGGGEEGEGGDEDMIVPSVYYNESDEVTCDMDMQDVASAVKDRKCICIRFVTYASVPPDPKEEESILLFLNEAYEYESQESYYYFIGYNSNFIYANKLYLYVPLNETPYFRLLEPIRIGACLGFTENSIRISGKVLHNSLASKSFLSPPFIIKNADNNELDLCIFKKDEIVGTGSERYHLITFSNIATSTDVSYKYYSNSDSYPTIVDV